jgi:hypothetical protein
MGCSKNWLGIGGCGYRRWWYAGSGDAEQRVCPDWDPWPTDKFAMVPPMTKSRVILRRSGEVESGKWKPSPRRTPLAGWGARAADVGQILETLCAVGKARRGPPSAKTTVGQANELMVEHAAPPL